MPLGSNGHTTCHERLFYQIGGFEGHTNAWGRAYEQTFYKPLDPAALSFLLGAPTSPLWKDGKLYFVLGMKSTGSTSLLLPHSQMIHLLHSASFPSAPLAPPYPHTRFASISPITFPSIGALEHKLISYKSKRGRKDTSDANKSYEISGGGDAGRTRVDFERARVVWHVLSGKLNVRDWHVPPTPTADSDGMWDGYARVVSLAWNMVEIPVPPITRDGRKKAEMVDIGWIVVNDPSSDQVEASKVDGKHFRFGIFTIPGKKEGKFHHGRTKTLPKPTVSSLLLQDLTPSSNSNTLLLVYDTTPPTLQFLSQHLNLPISSWEDGISSLLGYSPPSTSSFSSPTSKSTPNPRDPRLPKPELLTPTKQSPNPNPTIHVISLKRLYETLTATRPPERISFGSILSHLNVNKREGVKEDGNRKENEKETWCAGNEAVDLYTAFERVVGGNAVDERGEEFKGSGGSSGVKKEETGDWWDEIE